MSTSNRSRWAAVGAAVAVTLGAGGIGITHATTSSGERPVYLPIEPCRLADTRPAPNTVGPRDNPIGAEETYTVDGWGAVGNCDLPTGTAGLSLNVTAVGATRQTNLRFFPAGTAVPTAANLNPTPGAPPTPNAVNVDLSDTGQFSVFNKFGSVAVVIDVVGIYDDHDHDDRYYTETEVDAALSTKAASADLYTKNEVDAALSTKAASADVYTKGEVDAAIDAVLPDPVVSTTAKVGGTGGGGYDLPCPAGSIAVGLRGRVATFETPGINVISVACQELTIGRAVKVLGASSDTDDTGSAQAGGQFDLICPAGSAMTGASGMTRLVFGGFASVVTDLTVSCADLGNGIVSTVGPVHGVVDTPFSLDCATGSHVVGIGPASGDQLLDSLRLKCST